MEFRWTVFNGVEIASERAAALADVPEEIDKRVMSVKLLAAGITLDQLTDEQQAYMADWRED